MRSLTRLTLPIAVQQPHDVAIDPLPIPPERIAHRPLGYETQLLVHMPGARIEVVYLQPDAMHPYRLERIADDEPGRFRPEPSPVEPRPLERNPEPAGLVLHVQFVEHDTSGPLSARSL